MGNNFHTNEQKKSRIAKSGLKLKTLPAKLNNLFYSPNLGDFPALFPFKSISTDSLTVLPGRFQPQVLQNCCSPFTTTGRPSYSSRSARSLITSHRHRWPVKVHRTDCAPRRIFPRVTHQSNSSFSRSVYLGFGFMVYLFGGEDRLSLFVEVILSAPPAPALGNDQIVGRHGEPLYGNVADVVQSHPAKEL
jgi:hypothetical protein